MSIELSKRIGALERLVNRLKITAGIPGTSGYYFATISQSSTSNPTMDEILSTTGATVTATRAGIGTYTLTFSTDIFATAVPHISIAGSGNLQSICNYRHTGTTPSTITIYTGEIDGSGATAADDILDNHTILVILFIP